MKVTIDRKALADATKAVGRFLPARAGIPSLSHYLVEAHSGILALTAFNMESGRRVELEAEVEDQGDVLIPPALAKIVSGSNAETATIEVDKSEAVITVGKARAKLRLGVREDYPEAEPDITDAAEIPVSNWSQVQAACAAAGRDQARPVLLGVKLEQGTAIATDSYRLAYVELSEKTDHPEALVPAEAIRSLDVPVSKLYVGDRHVRAKLEDGAWWTRLIEGGFPKWRSLLPDGDAPTTVTFDSDLLVSAVKRAVSTIQPVWVSLEVGDGEVVVSAARRDAGEFSEAVPARTGGEPIKVAYNPAYLTDAFGPVEVGTLHIVDAVKPGMVRAGWWSYLLMPVRT